MTTLFLDLDDLDFEKGGGLVTVVAVDAVDGAVLMVAFADREALERTLVTGEMHYHSRTRGLWHKGSTSGNVQRVVELTHDCDADAILAVVRATGPACHSGTRSCFGNVAATGVLSRLDALIDRKATERVASASYTAALLSDRNLRLKKLGEEATELAIAAADGDPDEVRAEAADLLYHLLVVVRATGCTSGEVLEKLVSREQVG